LPTQQKMDLVQEIKGRLERSSITMTANYAGISVNQMIELRRAMQAGGVEFTIVKNTLLSLAADEANKPQLKEIIQGPTAVAIGYDDPVEAAKAMADYVRTGSSTLAIIGAVMGDGAVMSPDEFTRLASLPPKPIIIAMLLGQLNSPIARLVTVMNGPVQGLGNVLAARVRQLEEESPAPAAAEPEASAPADEAPAEEAPASEASSDDAPADEAPVDEAPAEEAAAEEPAAEAEEAEPEAEAAEEEPAAEAEPEAEAAGEEEAE
jgi:large subunit ribosomal protein L10